MNGERCGFGATMTDPRWLVDEMLGRLARYLRILGYDTEYAQGVDDEAIARRASEEGRRLVTRDRRLSSRSPGALLVTSPYLLDQLRSVRAAWPSLRLAPAFVRCTLCNGELVSARDDRGEGGSPSSHVYRCPQCGHRYWEGTHTRDIRALLRTLEATAPP